jgi:excisionase family DNA binding protein
MLPIGSLGTWHHYTWIKIVPLNKNISSMDTSVLIQNLTVDDLCKRIQSTIREELQLSIPAKGEEPQYLTRKEAASFLKISVPTLYAYTNSGRLVAFRIGRRVLYKLSDLEMKMEPIEISRYAKGKK